MILNSYLKSVYIINHPKGLLKQTTKLILIKYFITIDNDVLLLTMHDNFRNHNSLNHYFSVNVYNKLRKSSS